MGSHISTLEHLRKSAERAHQTLNHLKGSLRAMAHAIGKTVGVVGISVHHAWLAHAPIHAAAHASVHGSIPSAVASAKHGVAHSAAEARVGRGVRG